ncbi:MAG: tRNA lysidine(34) synthetase TilS, partial [Bacteroidaceae bacterium]|nr:tRNA lysidine(34) synthetase TilS [Bacteroidaceae bacterium]
MAARELRYQWFERLCTEQGAACVAVAHHEDDVAETVLLNLVRGTGIQGVSGMAYRNGAVIRPLLDVSRKDILDYLALLGQDFVTDSTNLEDDCKRNIVRLKVVPELLRLNPSAVHSIAQSARRLSDVSAVYSEAMMGAVGRVMEGDRVVLDRLRRETAPRSVLFECLKGYGFTSAAVEAFYDSMVEGESGRMLVNSEWRVLRNRDELIVAPQCKGADKALELDDYVETRFSDYVPGYVISRSRSVATLDADKVAFPLSLRRVAEGDRFHPFGMRGSKLLSDYMTDRKYSLFDKERQMVVTDASGAIVWVVGERSDNRFRVGDATKRVVELHMKN